MKNAEEIVAYLGDKKFLIGDEVCVADFVFFEHVNYMIHLNSTSAGKTPEKVWAKYPTLEGYHERMSNLPGLKEFIAREAANGAKDHKGIDIQKKFIPNVPMVKCNYNEIPPQ